INVQVTVLAVRKDRHPTSDKDAVVTRYRVIPAEMRWIIARNRAENDSEVFEGCVIVTELTIVSSHVLKAIPDIKRLYDEPAPLNCAAEPAGRAFRLLAELDTPCRPRRGRMLPWLRWWQILVVWGSDLDDIKAQTALL